MRVKQWLVRTGQSHNCVAGRYIVLAPTARLAVFNLRAAGIYAPIVTGPARVRKPRPVPCPLPFGELVWAEPV